MTPSEPTAPCTHRGCGHGRTRSSRLLHAPHRLAFRSCAASPASRCSSSLGSPPAPPTRAILRRSLFMGWERLACFGPRTRTGQSYFRPCTTLRPTRRSSSRCAAFHRTLPSPPNCPTALTSTREVLLWPDDSRWLFTSKASRCRSLRTGATRDGVAADLANVEEEIVVAYMPDGQWFVQISPRRVPGLIGRLLGPNVHPAAVATLQLARAVHQILASDDRVSELRWRWDGPPRGDDPGQPVNPPAAS